MHAVFQLKEWLDSVGCMRSLPQQCTGRLFGSFGTTNQVPCVRECSLGDKYRRWLALEYYRPTTRWYGAVAPAVGEGPGVA